MTAKLKITVITHYLVGIGNQMLVKIETDQGIVGYRSVTNW
jgi:hypothetical protein